MIVIVIVNSNGIIVATHKESPIALVGPINATLIDSATSGVISLFATDSSTPIKIPGAIAPNCCSVLNNVRLRLYASTLSSFVVYSSSITGLMVCAMALPSRFSPCCEQPCQKNQVFHDLRKVLLDTFSLM